MPSSPHPVAPPSCDGSKSGSLNVAVLGSTGSVGVSTLEVIAASQGRFVPFLLAANRSTQALVEQARACRPNWVVVADAAAAAGESQLRAEFGDRLPVVLLDGREHSYWDLDEERLRADITNR